MDHVAWVAAAPVGLTRPSNLDEAFGLLASLAGVAEDEIRITPANLVALDPAVA